MASVSRTSSLGNTGLRGFGGMASGIDRDAIIEQMSLTATTKIARQKKAITSVQWKQEAFQGLSGKILNMHDKFFSYSSSSSLKDASLFTKNQVTAVGDASSKQYVTATGSSNIAEHLSVLGVKNLATAAVQQSAAIKGGEISTSLTSLDNAFRSSNLEGSQLTFGIYKDGAIDNKVTFKLPSSYTDGNGEEQKIDYYNPGSDLATQLNEAIKYSGLKLGSFDMTEVISFNYDTDGTMKINADTNKLGGYVISSNSSALEGLGYVHNADVDKDGITFEEFNNANKTSLREASLKETPAIDYLKTKELSFNYNGSVKNIALITEAEAEGLKNAAGADKLTQMAANIQKRLDKAFGANNVSANIRNGALSFSTGENASLSISSGDSELLANLGIENGESNKVNLNGTLEQKALGISNLSEEGYLAADGGLLLSINGVDIKGLTKDSTIKDILSSINSSDAGVKASYISTTGQFLLVASETGAGRAIDLDSPLAQKLFKDNSNIDGGYKAGTNALVRVSYGNGMEVDLERSSNTFELEGLNITVSGKFGYDGDILDRSKAVSFTASADIDGVAAKISEFFKEYNDLVTEINSHVKIMPSSGYGPLTDEQKEEMSESEIEKWEKKSKEGLLYNNSVVRDLSADVQNMFMRVVDKDISLEDLEGVGITLSSNYSDGGSVIFNEAKLKDAMNANPQKVSDIFVGKSGSKGIVKTLEDAFIPYATRYSSKNGGSYGRLIEEAGSEKVPLSVSNNFIHKQLMDMQENLKLMESRVSKAQERYIRQFTAMETMISKMNSQSSWISSV